MARKSRKGMKQFPPAMDERCSALCKTGIYVRLSVEDNGGDVKDSIQNQIEYLKEYVNRNSDDLQLVKVYEDNGTTGTNFLREGWQSLLEDVRAGGIDCIVVKDFSRMGRNYIEVGNYLEKIFPFLGVRIISVNDDFDSRKQSFESNMLMNSLTNIVNDYYAKDISRKVVQARRAMQENGEYTSGVYPYGYRKSNNGNRKMSVDPEVSVVVKKIFEWRCQGKSSTWIINSLNTLAIPSPGLYRFMNGKQAYKKSCNAKWNIAHISGILKNPVYLGHLVQGKSKRSYFRDNGKKQRVPREEWIIIENAHEPLITREQFDIAAKMAETSHKKYSRQMKANADVLHRENLLRRKVYCGQCGCMMCRRSRVKEGIRSYYYFCDAKRTKIDAECTRTMVSEEALMEPVRDVTIQHLQLAGNMLDHRGRQEENLEKKSDAGDGEATTGHGNGEPTTRYGNGESDFPAGDCKRKMEQDIMLIKQKKRELYEDMKEGILTRSDFVFERGRLAENQARCEEELKRIEDFSGKEQSAIEILDGKEIPLELLDLLIQKIVVFSAGRVEIAYTYDDMMKKWCEGMQTPFQKVVSDSVHSEVSKSI